MGFLNWSDNYSVNIRELDEQHKQIVEMLNELNDAMAAAKGKQVIGDILNRLIDYATTHFATEEKYFEQYGYPDTEEHKKEHNDFVLEVNSFKTDYDNGKSFISFKVMNFLKDWLLKHILNSDKNYTEFLNSKGVY